MTGLTIDKWAVAKALDEIARYLELSEANRFKTLAFERASQAIENITVDLEQLVKSGELYKTPGIGKAIGPIVTELVASGRSAYLEELREQYPPGIFDLMRVPKLGLKKIGVLYSQLGVSSLDELEAASRAGRVAALKGFGAKTQETILEGIAWARDHESHFLLPVGLEVGESLAERIASVAAIDGVEIAGSVRRRLEVISNVNLVISTMKPARATAAIATLVEELTAVDDATFRGRARGEIDVLFHLTHPDDFGATMLRATGSVEFVQAFEKRISEDAYELRANGLHHRGRHLTIANEHDLFEKVGIPFLEPERRENGAELARKKRVSLVEPADLRGTFHVHTTYSDGRHSVLEMLQAARDFGFEYVGLSDHSQNASYAGGLTPDRLHEQHAEIDRHREEVAPMRVFRGTEADILNDGTIDYGDKILPMFDFVIASVHSRFNMPKDEMTERILRALDDPHVTFLGHMTGRKLLSRQGYTFDYDRVFERAAERGVMIEINGNPNRLDIDWRLIRRALDRGVRFSINPDAHSTREFAAVLTGTWVARKGGLPAREIFNTFPLEAVEEHFAQRKAALPGHSNGAAKSLPRK
ncbi:MAG: DNA polymerase/3'-5' exonuclease PolX [Acidobacteriota bacterium]